MFLLLEIFVNGWKCFLSVWLMGMGRPMSQSLCHMCWGLASVWGEMGCTVQDRA